MDGEVKQGDFRESMKNLGELGSITEIKKYVNIYAKKKKGVSKVCQLPVNMETL